jgi:hypothetical protein
VSEQTLSAQYVAAMQRVGNDPVVIESTVVHMSAIIAALQLALRHPLFPPESQELVERFVQGFLAQVRTKDLVIAQVLERGNDPEGDTRPTRRRFR